MTSIPPTPLSRQRIEWVAEAFRRSGMDPVLGARLGQVMAAAGLRHPTVRGLQTYGETDDPSGRWMAAQIVRTLLPVILSTGVATAAELDIDTLEDRLAHELVEHGAIYKPPVLVGAWARV